MKRRVFLLLLLLVAGAIVNVAVAWGCAWLFPIYGGAKKVPSTTEAASRKLLFDQTEPLGPTHWALLRNHRFGSDRHIVTVVAKPSPRAQSFDDLLPDIPGFAAQLMQREAAPITIAQSPGFFVCDARGWPMRSVRCEWPWWQWAAWPQPPLKGGIPFGTLAEPRPWPIGVHEIRALPYMPIWPGFAINTLFYAVILWMLFAAPFALRRRRRIKRGLCPKCAYDLRNRPSDSSACPECGAPAPHAETSSTLPMQSAG